MPPRPNRTAADPGAAVLREFAPAKINLYLHVLGRRADGYHSLESLVSFADIGDDLALEPGAVPALTLDGPMAAALSADEDNLVLKAARLFAEAFPGAATGQFHLTKNLPVASGIGGGSSDAAAALRLLARANRIALAKPRLMALARALGADVPVCLEAKPCIMRGIGHDLEPVLMGEAMPAVLINPGVAVETRAVFGALALQPGEDFTPLRPPESASGDPALRILAAMRNDLEAPAMAVTEAIGQALDALRAVPGCRFARMSGSGATCFGLFETLAEAQDAADSIQMSHPHWWVRPCRINLPF
ncbi:MAG: 4-diphosphocytidyl-2-C-methyl-D-erythritol [Beijerinckiaceae bacterium]|nr:MAG: 4-diphosphocytidyl-2-C-methyl-D-erythritol [Beijerinckiaceae bacterium]